MKDNSDLKDWIIGSEISQILIKSGVISINTDSIRIHIKGLVQIKYPGEEFNQIDPSGYRGKFAFAPLMKRRILDVCWKHAKTEDIRLELDDGTIITIPASKDGHLRGIIEMYF